MELRVALTRNHILNDPLDRFGIPARHWSGVTSSGWISSSSSPLRINPDSPDEMAFGQLRAPNLAVTSNSYAESSSRILTDPTGERRNRQFCQRFRGLRSCWPNPSGESGFDQLFAQAGH